MASCHKSVTYDSSYTLILTADEAQTIFDLIHKHVSGSIKSRAKHLVNTHDAMEEAGVRFNRDDMHAVGSASNVSIEFEDPNKLPGL